MKLVVVSLLCDLLVYPHLDFSYKIADSSGASAEAPLHGVGICSFNLVRKLDSFTHLLVLWP